MPPGVDGTYQPSYDLWSTQVSKRFASLGAYGVNVYAQVDNMFDADPRHNAAGAGTLCHSRVDSAQVSLCVRLLGFAPCRMR